MPEKINIITVEKLANFSNNRPIFMLNYLNYKGIVIETGKSGKVTYIEYLKAAAPFFEKIDAEIIFKGTLVGTILGPLNETLLDEF